MEGLESMVSESVTGYIALDSLIRLYDFKQLYTTFIID